uniref:Uncharacterized protein n=1 Tax=Setaria digitata TaxID=48799 RepID=A0A915Q184_9BILA
MSSEISETEQSFNDTWKQLNFSENTYDFTKVEKGLLFLATGIGNLIGTYPVIVLEEELGIR